MCFVTLESSCKNGRYTNVTGNCDCLNGWTGKNCNRDLSIQNKMIKGASKQKLYFKSCKPKLIILGLREENCKDKCKNNGFCDIAFGNCYCLPGFEGKHCEIKCKEGHYGLNCKEQLNCKNREFINIFGRKQGQTSATDQHVLNLLVVNHILFFGVLFSIILVLFFVKLFSTRNKISLLRPENDEVLDRNETIQNKVNSYESIALDSMNLGSEPVYNEIGDKRKKGVLNSYSNLILTSFKTFLEKACTTYDTINFMLPNCSKNQNYNKITLKKNCDV